MEPSEKYLFKHKGCYFIQGFATPEYIDSLQDFEIRDSDVFIVSYPKSGTRWTQHILSMICYEGHRNGTEGTDLFGRAPQLEYNIRKMDNANRPSPRHFATHMHCQFVPRGLGNGRTKVIYVARNPKDVLVSFYHYSKIAANIEGIEDFDIFMERFLAGKMVGDLWLDHIEGWWAQKDNFNILFLMYEEMKKNLRSSILKICNFLGKSLTEKVLDDILVKASFEKMRTDPRICIAYPLPELLNHSKGRFLRKGTIGDWKNTMTVAQSERFDSVFKERMEKLPFKFCWDINDE
ncbi:amine sulfotransferase [Anolis carolinensis]|uniref:amine sulfotransferase n=1 Tax=Anolis carolinensis TaxID=28377 RepID=UPI002F2B562B